MAIAARRSRARSRRPRRSGSRKPIRQTTSRATTRAAKLAILCAVALRAQVRRPTSRRARSTLVDAVDFRTRGALGCTIRQVSQAERTATAPDCLRASVRPGAGARRARRSPASTAARTSWSLRGHYGGETVLLGMRAPAADRPPSPSSPGHRAQLRAARAGRAASSGAGESARSPASVTGEFVTPHYLRFIVRDRPGILAAIAGAMAQHDINIDAVLQLPADSKDALPFVVTVEACPPAMLGARARRDRRQLDFHVSPRWTCPILGSGA